MKTEKLKINGLDCMLCGNRNAAQVAYVLYPAELPERLVLAIAGEYGLSVVVVAGMDWDNALTPWPADGVPDGSPDFMGLAPDFLKLLTTSVIPQIESRMGVSGNLERSLIGVSLSGLFTLWQWPQSDCFKNIATLSGSFWYDGFVQWVCSQSFAAKTGRCFMLLGDLEPHSRNKVFSRVGDCTAEIVSYLQGQGVDVKYETVPGNHYQHSHERLAMAFGNLFG